MVASLGVAQGSKPRPVVTDAARATREAPGAAARDVCAGGVGSDRSPSAARIAAG